MPIGNLNANLNLLSDYVNDMHNTLGYRMCMIAFGATYIDIEGHMKMKWNVCSLCVILNRGVLNRNYLCMLSIFDKQCILL